MSKETRRKVEDILAFADDWKILKKPPQEDVEEGGPGSGFFGHAGRPGQVGGSSSEGGAAPSERDKDYPFRKLSRELLKRYPDYAGQKFTKRQIKRLEEGLPDKVANRWKVGNDPEWEKAVSENPLKVLGPDSIPAPSGIKSIGETGNRQGRCYELAARFVLKNHDWELVHATLFPRTGQFEDFPYFHAYAIKGDTVYDAVLDKFYTKKEYYLYFTPHDEISYKIGDVCKNMYKLKTYGAWE